ncbi:cyclic di-GMP phosphodiesterase response regulator RpfG [Clostridium tepidiprofundi DSM 19306]|uniref:Cyclic di-GMP phosphodiesterase response regulator RpfG n=1 Tax=Clostridium tepidiprofundi DSM 19306 TaxID=1121338 RepID=A0A151B494_9CLOT|nr:HD-GYP domain-containing protein [Clostridium tepidiprofundi]KYH34729.1 cyclic di-GMP phosphodiesterase response regulator RpfG [Clostridium tepidiprofundi DSM 19306]
MRLEFIEKVKEDEILGKNIYTDDGSILLRAGVKLTANYIKKLKQLGVLYIYVDDYRLDDVYVEDSRLEEIKINAMKNISNVVKNINNGDRKGTRESISFVEDMVEHIIEEGDITKSLYDIKTYDNYTYMHSIDTSIMATFLGLSMEFNELELKDLAVGAILHDIGKTRVPRRIICKKGKLTEDEFDEVKKHPVYGKEMLEKQFSISNKALSAIEQHHERIDGKGYPYGLKDEQISKFGKVVAICDVYDAISNDRTYRKKFSPNEAYELIMAGTGTMFDQKIVNNFRNTFAVYPLGCCVRLSSGIEGYVIRQNSKYPDRPIIRILYDSETRKPTPFYEIDLLQNPSLVIEAIV